MNHSQIFHYTLFAPSVAASLCSGESHEAKGVPFHCLITFPLPLLRYKLLKVTISSSLIFAVLVILALSGNGD